MVAEGYNASKCIMTINKELKMEIPIIRSVYAILWEGASPMNTFKEMEKTLL
jgi:glycerol-3-phosphate dehydrogenase (NAD(P)+)